MDGSTKEDGGGTQTIRRCVAILSLLAANNRLGMRLVDVYPVVGLSRPTAHRMLQGLAAESLVRQDQQSKRYFLGNMLYELGLAAAPLSALRDLCHPHVQAVAAQTGDTAFLIIRSGFDGVCIDRQEGSYPIKAFVLEVGRRRPLNIGAGGTAILSALPADLVSAIVGVNHERCVEQYPHYSVERFRARLAHAQQAGYVVNDVLEAPGVRALAMPIRDAAGSPIAALSVSTVSSRLEGDRLETVRNYVEAAVLQIEELLNRNSIEGGGAPEIGPRPKSSA
jgi:DNA-binding IclR family transcriptional regulator